ncbi:MAG TPA: hypothetical protein VFS55_02670 [Dokdonella sp.]|nr:hypothetical protein [Dokdonella sp.]
MDADDKTCANPWCSCAVYGHDEFCSAACAEQASEGVKPPCNCVHQGCDGTVHESLAEG